MTPPPYRVIVIDDEPPARELMAVFVSRMPDLSCVASCGTALQGLQAIQHLCPDLVLLDIQMPELTGLDLMALPLEHRPEIILTTAYPEYALRSYDYAVVDYLVKPIAFDRFVKGIVKFRQRRPIPVPDSESLVLGNSLVPEDQVLGATEANLSDSASVWLRQDKRVLQILKTDILYIEGLRDYIKVHVADHFLVTHMGIGQAQRLFAPPQFIRIHRSHIVRTSAIRLIDGNTIELVNGTRLLIGPLYRDELKKIIPALL